MFFIQPSTQTAFMGVIAAVSSLLFFSLADAVPAAPDGGLDAAWFLPRAQRRPESLSFRTVQ